MNQYTKIWIPTGIAQGESVSADAKTIDGAFYKPASGLICMTIEELREMWKAAEEYIVDEEIQFDHGVKNTSPNFESYLTSKNIQI